MYRRAVRGWEAHRLRERDTLRDAERLLLRERLLAERERLRLRERLSLDAERPLPPHARTLQVRRST